MHTPPKFNSSPLKKVTLPKGKDRLPTIHSSGASCSIAKVMEFCFVQMIFRLQRGGFLGEPAGKNFQGCMLPPYADFGTSEIQPSILGVKKFQSHLNVSMSNDIKETKSISIHP